MKVLSILLSQRGEGGYKATFTGNRIDLIGKKSAGGGTFRVLIDGRPADEVDAFLMSYVQPGAKNSKKRFGTSPTVPRDSAPHGITPGEKLVPQSWTIVMTNDTGDYELTGSITGPDGRGNAFQPFTSKSGQIGIDPELWRRAERNAADDSFTFEVTRSVVKEISFKGEPGERFVVRLAQNLPNREHTLELVPDPTREADIEALEVFEPPLKIITP